MLTSVDYDGSIINGLILYLMYMFVVGYILYVNVNVGYNLYDLSSQNYLFNNNL